MWQPEDTDPPHDARRPEPWPVIRERLDRRLVGAYCAMRFESRSREWVQRELGLEEHEVEAAIRRGAEVYGHDVDEALGRVGRPVSAAERAVRRRRLRRKLKEDRVA